MTGSDQEFDRMTDRMTVVPLQGPKPALERGRGSEGGTSDKCFLVVFSDLVFKWHGYTMESPLNSHISFKMYISAVLRRLL